MTSALLDSLLQSPALPELVQQAQDALARQPVKEGVLTSEVIAGFEIPVRAVFDEAENARVLRRIWGEVR